MSPATVSCAGVAGAVFCRFLAVFSFFPHWSAATFFFTDYLLRDVTWWKSVPSDGVVCAARVCVCERGQRGRSTSTPRAHHLFADFCQKKRDLQGGNTFSLVGSFASCRRRRQSARKRPESRRVRRGLLPLDLLSFLALVFFEADRARRRAGFFFSPQCYRPFFLGARYFWRQKKNKIQKKNKENQKKRLRLYSSCL